MFDDHPDLEKLSSPSESWAEPYRQVVPSDLESIPPGPFLASILASVDRSRLNGHDAVRVMQADSRMASHFQALLLEDMVEVSQAPPSGPDSRPERDEEQMEFADTEVAAALRLTRRAAETQLGLALQLRYRLPRVWQLLYRGAIDLPRARVMADATSHLQESSARQVIDRVIEAAPRLTTGQLRARLQRLCMESDPEDARSRYVKGIEERRVVIQLSDDGTVEAHAYGLPADRMAAVDKFLAKAAVGLKAKGDRRTKDQLRADIFLDLLARRHVPTRDDRGVIELTIDIETLAGMAERAGEIPGLGLVIADVARQITDRSHDAEWRYAVRSEAGVLLHSGVTARRPTVALRRHVEARSRTCIFPGCRFRALACDVDHTVALLDGGLTEACNLAPLCRHHHRAKHQAPWNLEHDHAGVFTWTSPLEHTYLSGQPP